MSRPADPAYAIEEFAPDTNYPAGGETWNANATKVAPPGAASVGFSPDEGAAAQYHNYLHHAWSAGLNAGKAYQKTALDWTGQAPALNFVVVTSLAFEVHVMKWNDFRRKWLGIGVAVNDSFTSTFLPSAWPGATEIAAGGLTSQKCWDFDVDTIGNVLIVDDALDSTKEYNASTLTWTHHSGGLGDDPISPNVVYEPVSGLWCCAFRNGAGAQRVCTSANRGVSWTTRTSPAFASGSYLTLCSNGLGRIVMQGYTSTNGYFSYSDDGGVTWSTATTHTLGFTAIAGPIFKSKPVWNGSYWLAIFHDASSCKIFRSTDGATWSAVATLATPIFAFAAIGDLWCGITTNGNIVMSIDAGSSWQDTDTRASGARNIASNHQRFMITTGSALYVGSGMGMGGVTLT